MEKLEVIIHGSGFAYVNINSVGRLLLSDIPKKKEKMLDLIENHFYKT